MHSMHDVVRDAGRRPPRIVLSGTFGTPAATCWTSCASLDTIQPRVERCPAGQCRVFGSRMCTCLTSKSAFLVPGRASRQGAVLSGRSGRRGGAHLTVGAPRHSQYPLTAKVGSSMGLGSYQQCPCQSLEAALSHACCACSHSRPMATGACDAVKRYLRGRQRVRCCRKQERRRRFCSCTYAVCPQRPSHTYIRKGRNE